MSGVGAKMPLAELEALDDHGCRSIAESETVLELVVQTVNELGLVGEDRNAKIIFLAATTRLFRKPLNAGVKAPSSAGKSFTIETVLKLYRRGEDFEAITSASPKAMFYFDTMKHKLLYLAEAKGADEKLNEEFAYALRSLLSEGQLAYRSVERDGGKMTGATRTVEGPTGLMLSTTRESLDGELETRLLTLRPNTTEKQTKTILGELAREAAGDVQVAPTIALEQWHAFQGWLATGETRVIVPYAAAVAGRASTRQLRMRRDFSKLLALVKAHALVHRLTRPRDESGRIVATETDYRAVFDLAGVAFAEAAGESAPEHISEAVRVVVRLYPQIPDRADGVRTADVARELGIPDGTARSRLYAAIEAGWLGRARSRPLEVAPGNPLPQDGGSAFPHPGDVFAAPRRRAVAEGRESGATHRNGSGIQRDGLIAEDRAAAETGDSATARRRATDPSRRETEPLPGLGGGPDASATARPEDPPW